MVTWGIGCSLGRELRAVGPRVPGLGLHTGHAPNPLLGTPGRETTVCVNSPVTSGVDDRLGRPGQPAILARWPNPSQPLDNPAMKISLKTPEDIAKMRVSGALAAEVLQIVAPHVKAGVSTAELDRICHDHIVNVQKAIPANVGYKGFPATLCTSVNNVICHGIPSESKILKDGDIINIDVTVIKDGFHGDTSRMYMVGTPSVMAQRLVKVTREAMFRGIRVVRPGATLGDVGHAIQTYVESERFSVVREDYSHDIGCDFHKGPQVLHYRQPGTGLHLCKGMTFSIEP